VCLCLKRARRTGDEHAAPVSEHGVRDGRCWLSRALQRRVEYGVQVCREELSNFDDDDGRCGPVWLAVRSLE
jgi:hypothetical protein